MLSRRTVLCAAASVASGVRVPGLALAQAPTRPDTGATQPRLCMVEDVAYVKSPADAVQRRFDLYRQLGFGTLRTVIAWRHLEVAPDDWSGAATLPAYLAQAMRSGFRLKMSVETLGAPPAWFQRANEDAGIRNATGDISQNDMSLWYPGLHDVLAAKTDRLFRRLSEMGVFAALDWIFVDLGPASEPIYPAAWTQGKSGCRQATPWFYDRHAATSFARAMAQTYASIGQANGSWGTRFASWADVRLPQPGAQAGPMWQDALTWYRDSKRGFIRWQVGNYQRALASHAPPGAHPTLIIMVPGRHITPDEWRVAAATATPDCSLTIMTDTDFVLDLAKQTGCALQYTADENADEVRYVRDIMAEHGNTQILWGENVGTAPVAGRPGHIADVILANRLFGMDYVRSSRIFEADGITPNAVAQDLAAACGRLRAAWG